MKQTEALLLISSVQYGTLPAFSCHFVFAKIAQLKYICQIGRFFALSFFRISHVTPWRRISAQAEQCLLYLIKIEYSFESILSKTL